MHNNLFSILYKQESLHEKTPQKIVPGLPSYDASTTGSVRLWFIQNIPMNMSTGIWTLIRVCCAYKHSLCLFLSFTPLQIHDLLSQGWTAMHGPRQADWRGTSDLLNDIIY